MTNTQLRDNGLDKVEKNNQRWFSRADQELRWMRSARILKPHDPFTFEDLYENLKLLCGPIPHQNLAGSVMMNAIRKGYVEDTGRVTQTKGEAKHARRAMLYVWRKS